ncbi:putative ATPase [Methylorubrum pseudosasae]|nr:putative ATPase [Methylorubrum pseudosasae]
MPAVREIEAAGYRSLKTIRFPVGPLSVFVGGNGTGKTNLYRALGLLQTAASGRLTRALAAEGGMESVLWAGSRPQGRAGAGAIVRRIGRRDHRPRLHLRGRGRYPAADQ